LSIIKAKAEAKAQAQAEAEAEAEAGNGLSASLLSWLSASLLSWLSASLLSATFALAHILLIASAASGCRPPSRFPDAFLMLRRTRVVIVSGLNHRNWGADSLKGCFNIARGSAPGNKKRFSFTNMVKRHPGVKY